MNPPRRILLTPGPCTTSDTVKRAQLVPDVCPREPEFGAVIDRVRAGLLRVAAAEAGRTDVVLLAGPGTAAVESALGSLVPRAGRLLLVANGAYGARAAEIARVLEIPTDVWELAWTDRPAPGEFARRLAAGGPYTHAFWVHHETTTGLLNPLGEFGAICREHGVVSVVDAMSSFAGVELNLATLPVDVLISSANKCLQGLPGVAFVFAPRALLAAPGPVRSIALDLRRHWRVQTGERQFPFTAPTTVLAALAAAIDETLAEGVPARARRYQSNHHAMLAGMRALGFAPLLPAAWHSGLLTAFPLPAWPGFGFEAWHDALAARGITIYPGKLPGQDTFRIGVLGALTPADIAVFLAATAEFLQAAGVRRDAAGQPSRP